MKLLEILQEEKANNLKGGIYHQTQIKLAYNTNRIEGSKLSEEQQDIFTKPTHCLLKKERKQQM